MIKEIEVPQPPKKEKIIVSDISGKQVYSKTGIIVIRTDEYGNVNRVLDWQLTYEEARNVEEVLLSTAQNVLVNMRNLRS